MPFPTREEYEALGRIRANNRFHPDEPDRSAEDRRFLRERKRERHIRKLVQEWPPLSDETRARLAALLMPVESGDAA